MEQLGTWWFRLDKRAKEGEDAFPLVIDQPGRHWYATFDGLGGSGSRKVQYEKSRPRTHAWFASRLAMLTMNNDLRTTQDKVDHGWITRTIQGAMQAFLRELPPDTSRVRGRTVRDLPTTMAAFQLVPETDKLDCTIFWAGDSRVYSLAPQREYGLQQLTRDDALGDPDAYAAIRADAPMTNVIQASAQFEIHEKGYESTVPVIVFAATDGCFHYVHAPQFFELLILEAMEEADSLETWRDATKARIDGIRQDDASMVLTAWGWHSFAEMKDAFMPRLAQLRDQRECHGGDAFAWWEEYGPQYGMEMWKRPEAEAHV